MKQWSYLIQLFIHVFILVALCSCGSPGKKTGIFNREKEIEVKRAVAVDLSLADASAQQPWGGIATGFFSEENRSSLPFNRFGFPDEYVKSYDAEWFQNHCLTIVILYTNTMYHYEVSSMRLSDQTLHVSLIEEVPNPCTMAACYKAVLIEADRELITPGIRVTLALEQRTR